MDKSSFFEIIDKTGRMHWKNVKNFNVYTPEISHGDASFVYFAVRGEETMAVKNYAAQWIFNNDKILETELNSITKLGNNGFAPRLLEKPLKTYNNVYLIMELCNCGSMDMYLKAKKKVPTSIVRDITAFLARFLIEMKKMKMLHRDLNPKHILVNRDASGKISYKITSLLFCKDISEKQATSFVGTPDYMAPETCQEIPYSSPADVWSVGITLYELAVGLNPFKVDHDLKFHIKRAQLPEFPKDQQIDLRLKDLICRCLFFDPEKRITPEGILEHPFTRDVEMSNPLVGRKEILPPKYIKPVDILSNTKLLDMIEKDFAEYMKYVNDTEDHMMKLKCISKTKLDPYVLKSKKPLSLVRYSFAVTKLQVKNLL